MTQGTKESQENWKQQGEDLLVKINKGYKVEWRIDQPLDEVKAELIAEVESFAQRDRFDHRDVNVEAIEIYTIFEIEVHIGFMQRPYVYVWTRVVNKDLYWSLKKDRCEHKYFFTKSKRVASMDEQIEYIIDVKEF